MCQNLIFQSLKFDFVKVGGEPKEIVRSSGEYSPEVEEEITPSNPGGTEMPKEEDLPEAETYPENTRKKRNVNEEETTLMSILDPRLKRSVSKNNEGNLNSVVRIKRKMPKIQGPK